MTELYPKVHPLTKEEIEEAKKKGFIIKKGRLDLKEDHQLDKNFRRQLKKLRNTFGESLGERYILSFLGYYKQLDTLDDDAQKVEEESDEYKKLRAEFLQQLGHKIPNRQLHRLYRISRDKIAARHGLVKLRAGLTEADCSHIINTAVQNRREKKPVSYSTIAKSLLCTNKVVENIVSDFVSDTGDLYKKGAWSDKEDMSLIKMLLDTEEKKVQVSDLAKCKNVKWKNISQGLDRSYRDVYHKHHGLAKNVNSKIFKQETQVKINLSDKKLNRILAKIIYFLSKENCKSEKEIDWNLLVEKFDSKLSLRLIMQFWDEYLKLEVPMEIRETSYANTIDWLVEHKLHELVKIQKQRTLDRLERFYSK